MLGVSMKIYVMLTEIRHDSNTEYVEPLNLLLVS